MTRLLAIWAYLALASAVGVSAATFITRVFNGISLTLQVPL